MYIPTGSRARRLEIDMGTMSTKSTPAVGARFTSTDSRPWHDGDAKGVHIYTDLCEIVSVEPAGLAYKVVQVIEESGRPPFAGDAKRTGGSFAAFGWRRAIESGRVVVVGTVNV